MKPLRIISIGIFVLALAVLGAFIYVNQPKLCMQVIAEIWAKNHNVTPEMYIRQTADFLHMPAATLAELNEAWKKSAADTEFCDHSG